MLQGGMQSVEH